MTSLTFVVGIVGPACTVGLSVKNFLATAKAFSCEELRLVLIHQTTSLEDAESLTNNLDKFEAVTYISTEKFGLSLARNIGLQYVKTDFVIFLDDNSYFDVDMLRKLYGKLKKLSDGKSILIGVRDVDRLSSTHSKYFNNCTLTADKIPGRVCSNGIVVKTTIAKKLNFNIMLGVGSKYGSCEDWDFIWRLIKNGEVIEYHPEIYTIHPSAGDFSEHKSFSYGKGHGKFVRIVLSDLNNFNDFVLICKRLTVLTGKTIVGYLLGRRNEKVWTKGFLDGFFEN